MEKHKNVVVQHSMEVVEAADKFAKQRSNGLPFPRQQHEYQNMREAYLEGYSLCVSNPQPNATNNLLVAQLQHTHAFLLQYYSSPSMKHTETQLLELRTEMGNILEAISTLKKN